jgi:phosphatidylserine/phosphatidylglycerophosphate/cardiolipin synthase-like enzyme
VRGYDWVKNSLLCEIFVVEGKMLVVGSFNYSPFSFEKESSIYPLAQNGEESPAKMPNPASSTTPGQRTCTADPTGQILASNHPIDLAPYRGFALRQFA